MSKLAHMDGSLSLLAHLIELKSMPMSRYPLLAILSLALVGCVTSPPNQPSVMVLPGTDRTFEQFRADNDLCKQFANEQVGGRTTDGVALDSGTRSAAVGTLLGAAAGAAINGGRGAAAGAGGGLALGGLAGAGAADHASNRLQQRYDMGYQQCMYAKGHRIPAAGGVMGSFFRGYHHQRMEPASR